MKNNEYPKIDVIILYFVISFSLLLWFLNSSNGAILFSNILFAFIFGIPATLILVVSYIVLKNIFK